MKRTASEHAAAHSCPRPRPRARRGFALLAAMTTIAIVGLLLVRLSDRLTMQARDVRRFENEQQAALLAAALDRFADADREAPSVVPLTADRRAVITSDAVRLQVTFDRAAESLDGEDRFTLVATAARGGDVDPNADPAANKPMIEESP